MSPTAAAITGTKKKCHCASMCQPKNGSPAEIEAMHASTSISLTPRFSEVADEPRGIRTVSTVFRIALFAAVDWQALTWMLFGTHQSLLTSAPTIVTRAPRQLCEDPYTSL